MKLRWRGKTYVWGRDKANFKAALSRTVKSVAELSSKPVRQTNPHAALLDELQKFANGGMTGGGPIRKEGQSDRDKIVEITSLLADQLKTILLLKLATDRGTAPTKSEIKEIFEHDGPLASFADRITTCAALGLIPDDIKGDLRVLKKFGTNIALTNTHQPHSTILISRPSASGSRFALAFHRSVPIRAKDALSSQRCSFIWC